MKIFVISTLFLCSLLQAIQAQDFSLNFFSDRIPPQNQESFHIFFFEIEEDLPILFKNSIHKPISIQFKTFNYNKIKLSCRWRNYESYARLALDGTIEVNEQLMLPILNQHMDRDEHNCTYREVLSTAIQKVLLGKLFDTTAEASPYN